MAGELIDTADIERHFDALSKIGDLGPQLEDGFLRAAWSDEETAAMNYIAQQAQAYGFEHEFDQVGNLFIRTPGEYAQILQVGSHLDTVPRGGLFDGGAGIVAGLEALRVVAKQHPTLSRGLELVIWRGEEAATFKALYMGSLSAFGQANPELLKNSFGAKTLEAAIKGQGYGTAPITEGRPTISQEHKDKISAHIELHIEQARRLEIDKLDIGLVTSIRAPRNYRVVVHGEPAHSGATPMGIEYRKDAVLAMSYMHVRLDQALKEALARGEDLVQTVGVVNCEQAYNEAHPYIYENAMTRVSDFNYFLLNIRGSRKRELDEFTGSALRIIEETAKEFRTEVSVEVISKSDPLEALDEALLDKMSAACESLGYPYVRMPSGAGHDAAVVAKQKRTDGTPIPTAMIFIPCRGGISRSPLEFTSAEAVKKGAEVIAAVYSEWQT